MYLRLGIAALVLLLFVTSVFAIWPVVADAPWEDTTVIVESEEVDRCEAALRFRDTATLALQGTTRGALITAWDQIKDAEREVSRFCSKHSYLAHPDISQRRLRSVKLIDRFSRLAAVRASFHAICPT